MKRISDVTWHADRGTGSLAEACALWFSSSPDEPGHVAAWRRLLDAAGEARSDRSVLRWSLTVLQREHERRGGLVHPAHRAGA
jgi:hypothetical protein